MADEKDKGIIASPEFQDSFEWGSGAKDCKAKVYLDVKSMSVEEMKRMIDKAQLVRAHAVKEADE